MTKDKSLHLTPKQLGLEDNPMIHDADPLASDSGETDKPIEEELLSALKWAMDKGGLFYRNRIAGQNDDYCDKVDWANSVIKRAEGR